MFDMFYKSTTCGFVLSLQIRVIQVHSTLLFNNTPVGHEESLEESPPSIDSNSTDYIVAYVDSENTGIPVDGCTLSASVAVEPKTFPTMLL